MKFKQQTVQCLSPSGLHRMAYTEWGDCQNPRVLVCVHGLTRNGRDFDALAEAMSSHYRVICPDVVGRGHSSRLRDPAAYAVPQYVADMVTLIARLGVERIDWVGTSMGGLIGMALAAQEGTPIGRLVLNDVGPVISVEALQRIATYVGMDPTWTTFAEALAYVKAVSAPFGPLTEAQWWQLTETSVTQRADGRWGFLYDPQIAAPFKAAFVDQDIDLWPLYERIAGPTMVIRGGESDLLTRDAWQQMGERGPRAVLAEIPGVGHAPMFLDEAQISVVRDFLLAA
ncbi:MAG: alpha/beta hydrolase [Betaproteobacteria bacterium HGW-Betaproteobacteria-7]|jgi:pimeloyl-ACP methyl ester carboxylesterase|nr:MAG: alpha/beta hydrolase [Betaproteobacteria bacterium HGW-Betaproteobacteria-7]